jgi:hypothetical protein
MADLGLWVGSDGVFGDAALRRSQDRPRASPSMSAGTLLSRRRTQHQLEYSARIRRTAGSGYPLQIYVAGLQQCSARPMPSLALVPKEYNTASVPDGVIR